MIDVLKKIRSVVADSTHPDKVMMIAAIDRISELEDAHSCFAVWTGVWTGITMRDPDQWLFDLDKQVMKRMKSNESSEK